MGEETTQLDLTSELDRLAAMRGEGTGGDLRLSVHDAVLDPEGVDGRRMEATTVDGPADLRGRRWEHPLDALYRPHVTARRDETTVDVTELVDAVGGPDLDGPYVVDRETYVVGGVETTGETLHLRVLEAPAPSERAVGDGLELSRSAVETATLAGYPDRPRYRVHDRYGRATTLEGRETTGESGDATTDGG